jgi:DNA polymerase III delta prime subunit
MEHVELEEDALNTIMTVSEGDMRKAVTYLQSAHELAGKNSSISSDIVLDVSGQVISSSSSYPSTLILLRLIFPADPSSAAHFPLEHHLLQDDVI